jgi:hypothetical protein
MFNFGFTEQMMLTFFICHIIGMSSACSNPVLYGFLNENFAKGRQSEIRFVKKKKQGHTLQRRSDYICIPRNETAQL